METINVPIEDLKFNPQNPRKISLAEMNKLIRSIKEFGFCEPIVVNKHKSRYNIIIGGHQRVEAAKRIGLKQVPCVFVELDATKESLLNVALNEISGDWDDEKLYQLIQELKNKDADLTLTGFDEPFIDEILQAHADKEKDDLIDIAPPTPSIAKSKTGEIYLLGAKCICPYCKNELK